MPDNARESIKFHYIFLAFAFSIKTGNPPLSLPNAPSITSHAWLCLKLKWRLSSGWTALPWDLIIHILKGNAPLPSIRRGDFITYFLNKLWNYFSINDAIPKFSWLNQCWILCFQGILLKPTLNGTWHWQGPFKQSSRTPKN